MKQPMFDRVHYHPLPNGNHQRINTNGALISSVKNKLIEINELYSSNLVCQKVDGLRFIIQTWCVTGPFAAIFISCADSGGGGVDNG